ncbi:hypothetical protein AAFC00_007281 [Neodothiora populina]|uniref:Cystathionine gamma-synthase n=1 Tax=Neodothiora populina TaxID=2781224 RepID=A0ABR3PHZ6_9PEZI
MNGSNKDSAPTVPASSNKSHYSFATLGVHGDDACNSTTDVAPALHVSTTFRYSDDPDKLVPAVDGEATRNPLIPAPADTHIYSRLSTPNTTRLEAILAQLLGQPCLTYSSGLSAFHAILVHLRPRVVAIGAGYHGCHGVLELYQRLSACKIVDLHDVSTWADLGTGDVVHLETPLNPTGEASDIEHYAKLAHERGAALTVDATFAPPPLQDPFVHGADFVMHSGTKYVGGHSDMLCGIVAVSQQRQTWQEDYWGLYKDRLFLGAVMGSLEGWLGVRSLRTLELRITRQSANATELVRWLDTLMKGKIEGDSTEEDIAIVRKAVYKLQHSSLQIDESTGKTPKWLTKQMPSGHGPVFAIWMRSKEMAKRLPSQTHLFQHATSLGGVESLIEWRRMSDDTVDDRVLRVSIGVENIEDLKRDLLEAFRGLTAWLP